MKWTKHPCLLGVLLFLLCCGRSTVDEGSVREDCDVICDAWASCGEPCGCMEVVRTSFGCEQEAVLVTACLAGAIDHFACDDIADWGAACAEEQEALNACDRAQ